MNMVSLLVVCSLCSVWYFCIQMCQYECMFFIVLVCVYGVWLVDIEGWCYLDVISFWWVNLFGYINVCINVVLIEQLGQLEYVMLVGFMYELVVQFFEWLVVLMEYVLGYCFYVLDGVLVVEIVLKMSMYVWCNVGYVDKNEFICIVGGYYGEIVGVLGVIDMLFFCSVYEFLLCLVYIVVLFDV